MTPSSSGITKSERDDLLQIVRGRARLAKDQVVAYGSKLKADFEKQLDAHYPWDSDETWTELARFMEKAKQEAQEKGCPQSRTRDPRMGGAVYQLVLEGSGTASDERAQDRITTTGSDAD